MAYQETWSGKINRKLIKKLHITAKKSSDGACPMELTGLTTSPHHLEVTGLNKRRNGLLRSHYGTSWQTASCKNRVLSYRYSVFLDQKGVLAPTARIQAAVVGVASLTVTSNNPFAGFLLPILITLSSAGLEILVSNKGKLPQGTQ